MNRWLQYLAGPEAVWLVLTAAVYAFCARHGSGTPRDMATLERMFWLLPIITVPLVFATVLVPGARHWWWLGRAVLFSGVMLTVCTAKVMNSFDTGSPGQAWGYIITLTVGVVFLSLAGTAASAYILAGQRPTLAQWFREHMVLGSFATLAAAIPVGIGVGIAAALVFGVLGGLWMELSR